MYAIDGRIYIVPVSQSKSHYIKPNIFSPSPLHSPTLSLSLSLSLSLCFLTAYT